MHIICPFFHTIHIDLRNQTPLFSTAISSQNYTSLLCINVTSIQRTDNHLLFFFFLLVISLLYYVMRVRVSYISSMLFYLLLSFCWIIYRSRNFFFYPHYIFLCTSAFIFNIWVIIRHISHEIYKKKKQLRSLNPMYFCVHLLLNKYIINRVTEKEKKKATINMSIYICVCINKAQSLRKAS